MIIKQWKNNDFHFKALQKFTAAELDLLPLWCQLDKALLSVLSLQVQQIERKSTKPNY